MIRIMIDASHFEILPLQKGQNPYITHEEKHHEKETHSQHQNVSHALTHSHVLVESLPSGARSLPDIVFVANGGLALPLRDGLTKPLILLPNMKYPHRRKELPHLIQIFRSLGFPLLRYPGKEPFEGQAELKWFHGGRKAIGGYGQRATKKAFQELDELFETLYGKEKPEIVTVKLISPTYYHLDVAMLEFDDSKCILHRRSVSPQDLKRIEDFLGKENVSVIDTDDSFCLNAIVDGPNLVTHRLSDPRMKGKLESITRRKVVQVDTSEFEKSGGSVRCMVFDCAF